MTTLTQAATSRIDTISDLLARAHSTGFAPCDGGEFEIGETGMRESQGLDLERVVQAVGATSTIETGFAFGISGLYMLRGMLKNLGDDGGDPVHFAFDPYQKQDWDNAGLHMFEAADAARYLTFQERASEFALPPLAEAGVRFDLGFVDGNHRFDGAFVDILYLAQIVRPGGHILVDDTWMPSVRSAVNFFTLNRVLDRAPDIETIAPNMKNTAALRVPMEPYERPWTEFAPFGHERLA